MCHVDKAKLLERYEINVVVKALKERRRALDNNTRVAAQDFYAIQNWINQPSPKLLNLTLAPNDDGDDSAAAAAADDDDAKLHLATEAIVRRLESLGVSCVYVNYRDFPNLFLYSIIVQLINLLPDGFDREVVALSDGRFDMLRHWLDKGSPGHLFHEGRAIIDALLALVPRRLYFVLGGINAFSKYSDIHKDWIEKLMGHLTTQNSERVWKVLLPGSIDETAILATIGTSGKEGGSSQHGLPEAAQCKTYVGIADSPLPDGTPGIRVAELRSMMAEEKQGRSRAEQAGQTIRDALRRYVTL
ncbi:hypothetical protein F4778DRAFT_788337 [Xylariomycetidae sp. FL2044]|nr:hypothetical protein F4778DRAFT_788337 [Xylariomycetidae sp. FL2044]